MGPYSIFHGDDFIGLIAAEPLKEKPEVYELWYIIDPRHWNRGFASSAVEQLVTLARKDLNISTIFAEVVPDNAASLKVLEKNGFHKKNTVISGFRKNSIQKDLYVYSIDLK
jgi:ribosomal-protein-alanine N-acetyltransferase